MTAYKDFVQDFPSRCLDVLKLTEKSAELKEREVTVLLMVGSAGFVVPFERLDIREDPKTKHKTSHPSGDSDSFSKEAAALKQLKQETFLDSRFAKGAKSWKFSETCTSVSGHPDQWASHIPSLGEQKQVSSILKLIRNALAHGNIYTRNDPIGQIVLASKNLDDANFSVACVSPRDFKNFLSAWFKFLAENKLQVTEMAEALKDAA